MPIKKAGKINAINTELPLSGNLFEKNKRRISAFKLLKLIFVSTSSFFIIAIILYSIVKSNQSNAESITQDKIVSQLSKIINLPEDGLINIMRVSDAKNLSSQDNLYKDVKNGDYIIVYKSMVLVYNFDSRFIKNIRTTNK